MIRRRMVLLLLAGMAAAASHANPAIAGRWEADAQLSGAPLRLLIDIAPTAAGWVGSAILPGRGVKGAPLRELVVDAQGQLSFKLAALGDASAHLRLQTDGALLGELHQGGHQAALRLQRLGPAQVDLPLASTPISRELEGVWRGRYELGGYPRDVTLTLSQRDGVGHAELLIIGRARNLIPVDRVTQSEQFVQVVSDATGITIEGRWRAADNSLRGQFVQGPFEADFVLRKPETGSKP